MFIKPKEGLKVRNPETGKHLNKDGEIVKNSSYWLRRLNDQDVILVKEIAVKKTESKNKTKNEVKK